MGNSTNSNIFQGLGHETNERTAIPLHSDTLCPSAGTTQDLRRLDLNFSAAATTRISTGTAAHVPSGPVLVSYYYVAAKRKMAVSPDIRQIIGCLSSNRYLCTTTSRVPMDSHLERSKLYDVDDERWYLFWEGGSFLGRSADRTRDS